MAAPQGSVVLHLSLAHRSTLVPAARAAADTAAEFGLLGPARTELEAVLVEALTAVIADSFEGSDEIDVDVRVSREPGRIDVLLRQRGAPSTYVRGELPARLETLVGLGYADSMEFASDGVQGSSLLISRAVPGEGLLDDEAFIAEAALSEAAIVDADRIEVRPIRSDDVVNVARLYFRVYGYTKIGSQWIYEPDVFVQMLADGRHEAVVAQTPSGRIVGHAGLLRATPDSSSASAGPLAVEPGYRGRGLSERLGAAFLPRVADLHLRGIYAEAVTAHPASQKSMLRLGAGEVGLILGRQPADVQFRDFDTTSGFRRAVMVMYRPMDPSAETTVHVPARYQAIAEEIYAHVGLQRQVSADLGRPPSGLPPQSRLTTQLTAATNFARITVEQYGDDFVETLQQLLLRFQRERFEAITVHLPMADPLTSYLAAGLGELGLSFAAIFPHQECGDQLVLGMCTREQEPETIAVASEFGAHLRDFVLDDRENLLARGRTTARSRATMARILDGL